MKLSIFLLLIPFTVFSQQTDPRTMHFPQQEIKLSVTPAKNDVWVFVLAGQSNMAGRGQVEAEDTVPDPRILTINAKNEIIEAKEPLHWYEPTRTGLDCGLSFAKSLLQKIPAHISILLLPVAVGGSSISQWLNDSVHRGVKLYSNFEEKMNLGLQYGTLKAVLWHQGENDANAQDIPLYAGRLDTLIQKFRNTTGNPALPVLIGELGSYSVNPEEWSHINAAIHACLRGDRHSDIIYTGDLQDGGDRVHFNSEGQRTMGRRFAVSWLKFFYQK